jgi:hypothetical protein
VFPGCEGREKCFLKILHYIAANELRKGVNASSRNRRSVLFFIYFFLGLCVILSVCFVDAYGSSPLEDSFVVRGLSLPPPPMPQRLPPLGGNLCLGRPYKVLEGPLRRAPPKQVGISAVGCEDGVPKSSQQRLNPSWMGFLAHSWSRAGETS